jgi:hypothetical protein
MKVSLLGYTYFQYLGEASLCEAGGNANAPACRRSAIDSGIAAPQVARPFHRE